MSSDQPGRVEAVVTHHRSGFRSGVARFNELLAERLGVPLRGLGEDGPWWPRSLLSFKVSELGAAERAELASRLDGWQGELFLHELAGDDLERGLIARAGRVHCGNLEIHAAVRGLTDRAEPAWAPGLLSDRREYGSPEITVFSFGMAHKIRTDMFGRLRELLDALGRPYEVYVSAANHETARLEDALDIVGEMQRLFPGFFFLGNLSDVAVYNELRRATFFAAFFDRGVRANNTSVAAAMETGAVVVTNLDEHSPAEYVHLETVIDIGRCDALPTDPAVLDGIRARAVETAAGRGWDALVRQLGRA
ncbi:MAG TPA: hypothetical protein VFB35_03075 [Gaiellaceae bacterium]|nr:hypothetical protein [Gaiellaceae bacterium]